MVRIRSPETCKSSRVIEAKFKKLPNGCARHPAQYRIVSDTEVIGEEIAGKYRTPVIKEPIGSYIVVWVFDNSPVQESGEIDASEAEDRCEEAVGKAGYPIHIPR